MVLEFKFCIEIKLAYSNKIFFFNLLELSTVKYNFHDNAQLVKYNNDILCNELQSRYLRYNLFTFQNQQPKRRTMRKGYAKIPETKTTDASLVPGTTSFVSHEVRTAGMFEDFKLEYK